MKRGNVYRHYKGGLYTYKGIVNPYAGFNSNTQVGTLIKATHTETEEEVKVLMLPMQDVYISGLDHPVVLYKSTKDGKLWVRPVDMFFGWVMEDGHPSIQRFKLVEPK